MASLGDPGGQRKNASKKDSKIEVPTGEGFRGSPLAVNSEGSKGEDNRKGGTQFPHT